MRLLFKEGFVAWQLLYGRLSGFRHAYYPGPDAGLTTTGGTLIDLFSAAVILSVPAA